MAKISAYTTEVSPVTSDYMIVNDASGPTTKRMLLGFLPGFVAFNMANKGLAMSKLNNPYMFRVTKSADQTGIADAAPAKVTWDTETFDPNSNFASSTYTVPVTGYYQINYRVIITSSANNIVSYQANLYKNGAIELLSIGYPRVGFGETQSATMAVSELLLLTAGDTLDVYVNADVVSGTVTVEGTATAGSSFSGFLVST